MKMLLYLVIFLTTFCCICFSESNVRQIRSERRENCTKNFHGFDSIHLYSFEDNSFFPYCFNKTTISSVIPGYYLEDAILTCFCREDSDPIFFISPYFVNGTFKDIYYYCVLGKPEMEGMYDDYEVYDKLLFEHVKTIPNTLMTPFLDEKNNKFENDDSCLDKDGYPTKSIANQKTCFLAVKRNDNGTNEVFTGPLIFSELSNFGLNVASGVYENVSSCYTSVKNTTFNIDDHCIYSPSDSLFLCCCANEPKNCRTKTENETLLFCAPPELFINHYTSNFYSDIILPMQKYFNESVNFMCGINISIVEFKAKNLVGLFHVEYYSSHSCSPETPIIDISESKFCALEPVKPKNIAIQRCCKDDHFCNINLTPTKVKEFIINKCIYKPDISLYFDETNTCELYYDLNRGQRVYLHENFTTKIIHRTKKDYRQFKSKDPGQNQFISGYICNYIHAEIMNIDSQNCTKRSYTVFNSTESFFYCTCKMGNCDYENIQMDLPKSGFNCEYLYKTTIKDVIQSVQTVTAKDKWICYVKTNFFGEGSQIEAGHLEINSSFMTQCLEEGISNTDFCCVNIVNTDQNITECTVAKQIKRFKNGIKNPSENSKITHDGDLEHIHCYSKDISNSESEHCPKTDGCFSTRILRPSEVTSTNAFEPAGCLGYAEKYTVENLPLTSLSLGCRVDENSNRCSVVQTPEGEQRIVCCCNENDQNGLCNTNLNKVPQKIGRNISSFKSLN